MHTEEKTIFDNIFLDRIVDANAFVELMGTIPNDVNAISGNYVVNGKSILGLCSLNLCQPIRVEINGKVDKEFSDKVMAFKKPLVKDND